MEDGAHSSADALERQAMLIVATFLSERGKNLLYVPPETLRGMIDSAKLALEREERRQQEQQPQQQPQPSSSS